MQALEKEQEIIKTDKKELVEGWTWPKIKVTAQFSDNVRQYLNNLFDEGARSNEKIDPDTVAAKMRGEKHVGDEFQCNDFPQRNG